MRMKMKKIMEESLCFMESGEMREYLRQYPKQLRFWNYSGLIAGSRAPLAKKAATLLSIARKAKPSRKGDAGETEREEISEAEEAARAMLVALDETTNNVPAGTVFLLTVEELKDDNRMEVWDTIPFTTFEAARKYVTTFEDVYCDELSEVNFWVGKWIPREDGSMCGRVDWMLNADGEILLYRWFDGMDESLQWLDNPLCWSTDENLTGLPVPFSIGDIITVDCRPHMKLCHCVIVDLSDWETDCCSVSCIYINKDGNLVWGALKHNLSRALPYFSALLRAERFDGELPEREAPLRALSEALKRDPLLGSRYMHELTTDEQLDGITWETFCEKLCKRKSPEMAMLGNFTVGEETIHIVVMDQEVVHHFHFYRGEVPEDGHGGGCLVLWENGYFEHGTHTDNNMTKNELKALVAFLGSTQRDLGITVWEFIIATWNENNPKYRMPVDSIMPEYNWDTIEHYSLKSRYIPAVENICPNSQTIS